MATDIFTLRHWVAAARPVGHGMIAIPLLWGQALAFLVTQQFDWFWFAIIHVFGALCQIYSLYLNDYADEAIDKMNETYWLSGGSRVIPDGYLSGQQLFRASFIALSGIVLISAAGYFQGRAWMPVLGVVAICLGWTYSLAPIKSSYKGYGELHQSLSCAVFLPLTAFYLQAGTLASFPWLFLLPISLMFFAGNIITAIPDVASDMIGDKKTYPVRHGGEKARRDAVLLLLVACILIVIFSIPWFGLFYGVLISGPAVALLTYIYHSGLVESAEAINTDLCKRYILLTTMSQLWVMVMWSIILFWHGL